MHSTPVRHDLPVGSTGRICKYVLSAAHNLHSHFHEIRQHDAHILPTTMLSVLCILPPVLLKLCVVSCMYSTNFLLCSLWDSYCAQQVPWLLDWI